MQQLDVLRLLENAETIMYGHFVGTSGMHMTCFVAKDNLAKHTLTLSTLCFEMARPFKDSGVQVVVAPAIGAIAFSQWVAYSLSHMCPKEGEVLATYAEQEEVILYAATTTTDIRVNSEWVKIHRGEKLVVKKPKLILKRGFAKDVSGKKVLVIEDTLSTGESTKRTVQAVRDAGGNVIGVSGLVNGGSVTAEQIGVPILSSLASLDRPMWFEQACAINGPCAEQIPINTEYGHGGEFLKRNGLKS